MASSMPSKAKSLNSWVAQRSRAPTIAESCMPFNCGRQARPNLQKYSSWSREPLIAARIPSQDPTPLPLHTPSPQGPPNNIPPLVGVTVDSKAREGWRKDPTNDVSSSFRKGGGGPPIAIKPYPLADGSFTRPSVRGPVLCVSAAFGGEAILGGVLCLASRP